MSHPLPLLWLVALALVHSSESQPTQDELVRSPEDGKFSVAVSKLGIMRSYFK